MKFLHKNITLEGNYTNHSIRATVITTLDNKGFEARHIITLSLHKNESTIKDYSTKCPENKRKEMFNSLNDAIVPKKSRKILPKTPSATVPKAPEIPTISDNNTVKVDTPGVVPNVYDVKQNLPMFDLMQMGDIETIDDAVLQDLLNNDLDFSVTNTNKTDSQPDQKQESLVSNKTINTQVNTINVPPEPVHKVPLTYFQNSSVTINYNYNK